MAEAPNLAPAVGRPASPSAAEAQPTLGGQGGKMTKPVKRHRSRSRLAAIPFLLAISLLPLVLQAQEDVGPIDSTMAFQLLKLEQSVRQVPADVEILFSAALDDATASALRVKRNPKTRDEAVAVLSAIQEVLARYNFLQPPDEKDWPQTLGIALTKRSFSAEELDNVLRDPDNTERAKHINRAKPFYFVDCDMGSQFFIAVGERLGWDIRLVEVPRHNFVRWHLSEAVKVNWDWTRWQSSEDSSYLVTSEDPRVSALYLRSLDPREARGYYVGLIGSEAKSPLDAERLFKEAVAVLPHHPLTLNNLAWFYATTPEFASYKSHLAVAYGLAAWSMRPYDGNYADTVACAFAAAGEKALGENIEGFAIEHARSTSQIKGFQSNRELIKAGKLCNP